jgi:hypothetical protein
MCPEFVNNPDVKSLLSATGVQIPAQIFRLPHGRLSGFANGAHVEAIFKIKLGLLSDISIIRPYLYTLLPENAIKSMRFIVDILYFI